MDSSSTPAVTVVGAGNIGTAVARLALESGAAVQVLDRDAAKAAAVSPTATAGTIGDLVTGDIVVLALPYDAFDEVLGAYPDGFAGKVVVDPSNPVDFTTLDVVTPAGSSGAAQLAGRLPAARVLKAFNTNFAATLVPTADGAEPTAVLVAGDDADAKAALAGLLQGAGLRAVDAGPLKRAHELEALGALQIGLAVTEQTPWTGGFALAR